MVNMTTVGAYYLRRQKGAEGFRKAWEAALDFGVARMKDIAFERAITGYLVPMFVGGKLIGWRRKYNDRLLMFCLRHYGEDGQGKRTKIEYFSTRAAAGASTASTSSGQAALGTNGEGGGAAVSGPPPPLSERSPSPARGGMAEASTTTVRTVISGPSTSPGSGPGLDLAAEAFESFDGIELDEEARAAIAEVLRECAARRREVAGTADDESEPFVAALPPPMPTADQWKPGDPVERPLPVYDVAASPESMVEITPREALHPDRLYRSGDAEMPWEMLDDEEGMRAVEEAAESVRRGKKRKRGGPE